MIDYTGPNGLRQLVDDYRLRFVAMQYMLAGFAAPGRSLQDSLSLPAQVWWCW